MDHQNRPKPSYDEHLEFRQRVRKESLADIAKDMGQANVDAHFNHITRQDQLSTHPRHDPIDITLKAGERMAEMREQGFQGTDNELLFVARRDLTEERYAELYPEDLAAEKRNLAEQEKREDEFFSTMRAEEIARLAEKKKFSRRRGRSR